MNIGVLSYLNQPTMQRFNQEAEYSFNGKRGISTPSTTELRKLLRFFSDSTDRTLVMRSVNEIYTTEN